MKRSRNSSSLWPTVLLFLLFLAVWPSRAERLKWSGERHLVFGLGSLALIIGAVKLSSKLDERAQRKHDRAGPPGPSGGA